MVSEGEGEVGEVGRDIQGPHRALKFGLKSNRR